MFRIWYQEERERDSLYHSTYISQEMRYIKRERNTTAHELFMLDTYDI